MRRHPGRALYAGGAIEGKTALLADFIGGCGAGRLYCSIEPEGDVQPCVFLPITVGNVRDTLFLISGTHQSSAEAADRNQLRGACASCDNRYICGGCRARGWAYFGDIHAPDPGASTTSTTGTLQWDEEPAVPGCRCQR